MNRKFRLRAVRAACALAAAGLTMSAGAAQPPATLVEAIALAQSRHLSVRQADVSVEQARARLVQSTAAFYPTLDLLFSTDHTKTYDTNSGITATAEVPQIGTVNVDVAKSVPRNQLTPALRVNYDVYNGGQTRARLAQSEFQLRSAQIDASIAQRDTAYRVAVAYLRLQRAMVDLNGSQSRTQRASRRAETSMRNFQDGAVAAVVDKAEQYRLREAQAEEARALLDFNTAELDYLSELGLSPEPGQASVPASRFEAIEREIDAVMQMADDKLESERGQFGNLAADEEVKANRASTLPTVSLFAQYSGIGRSNGTVPDAWQEIRRRDFVVGVRLSYNLFDGSLREGRIAESVAQRESARLQAEAVAQDARTARDRAVLDVRRNEAQRDVIEARMELKDVQLEAALAARLHGSGSAQAVDDAQQARDDARSSLSMAKLDVLISRLALSFSTTAWNRSGNAAAARPAAARN